MKKSKFTVLVFGACLALSCVSAQAKDYTSDNMPLYSVLLMDTRAPLTYTLTKDQWSSNYSYGYGTMRPSNLTVNGENYAINGRINRYIKEGGEGITVTSGKTLNINNVGAFTTETSSAPSDGGSTAEDGVGGGTATSGVSTNAQGQTVITIVNPSPLAGEGEHSSGEGASTTNNVRTYTIPTTALTGSIQ